MMFSLMKITSLAFIKHSCHHLPLPLTDGTMFSIDPGCVGKKSSLWTQPKCSLLCNVPPVICNTLSLWWCIPPFGKHNTRFLRWVLRRKSLRIHLLLQRKGRCLHTAASDAPAVSELTPGACMCSHIRCSGERLPFQATGTVILCNKRHKKRINWCNQCSKHRPKSRHSWTVHPMVRLFFKKRSLQILKFNGPRESWSSLSFLLLASDDL